MRMGVAIPAMFLAVKFVRGMMRIYVRNVLLRRSSMMKDSASAQVKIWPSQNRVLALPAW
jgi:hypothetical protein